MLKKKVTAKKAKLTKSAAPVKKKVTKSPAVAKKKPAKVAELGLSVGDKAPVFSLPTDTGGDVSLAGFKGKKHVVLFFYPKDNTPGCTKEACAFQADLAKFTKLGAVIVGVSPDSTKSHSKFRKNFDLEFELGADDGAAVAKQYGVWVEKSMYGRTYMGIQRATFLIGKDGKIAHVWPKVSVEGHSDEVLAVLKAL